MRRILLLSVAVLVVHTVWAQQSPKLYAFRQEVLTGNIMSPDAAEDGTVMPQRRQYRYFVMVTDGTLRPLRLSVLSLNGKRVSAKLSPPISKAARQGSIAQGGTDGKILAQLPKNAVVVQWLTIETNTDLIPEPSGKAADVAATFTVNKVMYRLSAKWTDIPSQVVQ